jgi:hypothetical protein
VVLSKFAIGLAECGFPLVCGFQEEALSMLAKVTAIEFFLHQGSNNEDGTEGAQKYRGIGFGGSDLPHCCGDLISQHAPYLLVIAIPGKPGLVTGHNITDPILHSPSRAWNNDPAGSTRLCRRLEIHI